jgi:hypothetical protein
VIDRPGAGMPPHPMDVGALFDAALKFYRDQFVTLIGASALITVPAALLTVLAGPDIGNLISVIVGLLLPAVTVIVAEQVIASGNATIGSTWRQLRSRTGVLLLTALMLIAMFFAWLIAIFIGLLVLVVPGILVIAVGAIFAVRWSFVIVVTAIEDERYGDALSRSGALVAGHWWRVLGIVLLASFVVDVAEFALGAAFGGIAVWATVSADSFDRLLAIASAPILVLLLPLTASFLTMLYYDQRVRKEGTDIAAALEAIALAQPGPQL